MKSSMFFFICIGVCMLSSCKQSTDSDTYDSIWKPYSETKWVRSGIPAEAFSPTTGGFSFAANIADTGTYTYTFIPSIYIVSNMTSAKNAAVSFRSAIVNSADTLLLTAGGTQIHTFGLMNGSIQSKGADSVLTGTKAFAGNSTATISMSVNPDECSRELRFNVTVTWNPFTGGATVNPLPKKKKLTIEFFDIQMRANGITVLSQ